MTLTEARQQFEAAAKAIPAIVDEARGVALRAGLDQVRAEWPIGETGESRDAWDEDGEAIVNPLPYVQYVHDGIAEDLVSDALRDAEPTFHAHVEARLAELLRS